MTVPVSGSTNVIRSEVADTFNSQVTDVFNALSKWAADTTGQLADPAPLPAIPLGWTQTNAPVSYSPANLTSLMLPGQTIVSAPSVLAAIPLGEANMGILRNVLVNTSLTLSRCRNVRLQKFYTDDVSISNLLLFDVTNPSHMDPLYQSGSLGVSLADGDIDASSINTFTASMYSAIEAHRLTVLNFSEQWCHTSCHASHSSRSRR